MFFLLFSVVLILRLAFWIYFFRKFPFDTPLVNGLEGIGVSIVVCLKNGKELLKRNINTLLNQDFALIELVIVDDFSVDGLEEFVQNFNDSRVRYIKAVEDIVGKKKALECGVQSANYDLILVTDVDCAPVSTSWVKVMVGALCHDGDIVLGFGKLNNKRSLLGDFISFETFYVAMQYFSYAARSRPYMGVGRNMLFRKSTFLELNPYKGNYNSPGGDDDIFVTKAFLAKKTIKTCTSKNAWTVSNGKEDWQSFFNQKKRHVSSSTYYSTSTKIILGAFAFSHLLFYLFLFGSIIEGSFLFSIGPFFLFYIITGLVQSRIFLHLEVGIPMIVWPFLDFLFSCYLLFLGSLAWVLPKRNW